MLRHTIPFGEIIRSPAGFSMKEPVLDYFEGDLGPYYRNSVLPFIFCALLKVTLSEVGMICWILC